MSTIEVKNTAGEKVADLELSDAVYGIEPNASATSWQRIVVVPIPPRTALP